MSTKSSTVLAAIIALVVSTLASAVACTKSKYALPRLPAPVVSTSPALLKAPAPIFVHSRHFVITIEERFVGFLDLLFLHVERLLDGLLADFNRILNLLGSHGRRIGLLGAHL